MTNQKQLSQIYLDANATTPVLPIAAQAAMATMNTQFGNPSSSHVSGLQAKQIMEQTRQKARSVIGAASGQLIFTSGATEGIQTAILSALTQAKKTTKITKKHTILYGATEHKAVPESLKHWNEILEIHAEIKAIPVDKNGQLDLDFISKEAPNALMICTMAVNNETGIFQDLSQLETTIRAVNPNVFWMVDCVQALGKLPLQLENTTIDYAPFSGHKLYAMKGIGFIYVREGAPFTPFIAGGGQESGLRSGTENLPGLASLNVIFDELLGQGQGLFSDHITLSEYRAKLASALVTAFPNVTFNHPFELSVPTTLNFSIPSFSAKEILDLFDAANIRVSSGSACSSKVTGSFVLDAMGLEQWQSESAIRLSFGPAASKEEIVSACERIETCAKALGHSCLLSYSEQLERAPLQGLVQFKVNGSCTWLFVDNKFKTAVVIDPLPELSSRLLNILDCQGLTLSAVIDTHGHADHASSRLSFLHKQLQAQPTDHLGWPKHSERVLIKDSAYEYIELGEHCLVKIPTPGHTEDSISLALCEKHKLLAGDFKSIYTFCGDLILMGSLGRTNFDTSNAAQMYASIKLLNDLLDENDLLCPSHDYHNEFSTTLFAEQSRNTLLKRVIDNTCPIHEFVVEKQQLDSHINDQVNQEIMCGAFVSDKCAKQIPEYEFSALPSLMDIHKNIKLIDIREPHEYSLGHARHFDTNVPLSRLVNFIAEQQHCKEQPLLLMCRSGSRSNIAAQALMRLGFRNVSHLKGGYALA